MLSPISTVVAIIGGNEYWYSPQVRNFSSRVTNLMCQECLDEATGIAIVLATVLVLVYLYSYW